MFVIIIDFIIDFIIIDFIINFTQDLDNFYIIIDTLIYFNLIIIS